MSFQFRFFEDIIYLRDIIHDFVIAYKIITFFFRENLCVVEEKFCRNF